jgi:hypothetical protein
MNFANTIPGTVTGNSDTADYKDTVLAAFPPVSNCGTLIIRKATTPAGGEGSFPYTVARPGSAPLDFANPPSTSYEATLVNHGDSDTYQGVREADDFTLTEGALASPWAFDSIACIFTDDGLTAGNGTNTNGSSFKVEAGRTTQCTITNKRLQGVLRVIKMLTNDNGGTQTTFSASLGDKEPTPTVISLGPIVYTVDTTYDAGQTFNVVELGLPIAGYTTSYSGDCQGTIEDGKTKECTIINDDIPPQLTLVKVLIKDSGGTGTEADFTLTATGPTGFFGAGPSVSNGASFDAGTYSLSESTQLTGWEFKGWACVVNGGASTPNPNASITLGLGDIATCTVTNDDMPASPAIVTAMSWVLKDEVTLTGLRTGAATKGNITFTLHLGTTCTAQTQIGSPEVVSNIAANGTFSTPTGTTVTQAQLGTTKTYSWIVKYTGDEFNAPTETACGDERHTITIP